MREDGTVHIGNARGRIAIWCDESEATEIAQLYLPTDGFYKDVMWAIEKAYLKDDASPLLRGEERMRWTSTGIRR